MGGGAWPFLVGGVICLVNSDNERDLNLLNSDGDTFGRSSTDHVSVGISVSVGRGTGSPFVPGPLLRGTAGVAAGGSLRQ